jgi:HD-GYP domain-containing protein (c-di-GMP phosphodiesterase class II)
VKKLLPRYRPLLDLRELPLHKGVLEDKIVVAHRNTSGVRQAELIMALSLATDLGTGRPMEWALCSALLGIRLGEALGLNEQELRDVFYLALLRYIGCTSDMETTVELFGDEPATAGRSYDFVDSTKPRQMLDWMLHYVGAGQSPLQRIRTIANMPSAMGEHTRGHCEVAEQLTQRLGFEKSVQEAIWHIYERWDGSGYPQHLKGETLSLPMRVVQVVQNAESFRRKYGLDAAIAAIHQRAGHALDPRIAARFCEVAAHITGGLEEEANWETVLTAEPGLRPYLSNEALDDAVLVLADFVDLLSPDFVGHSRKVAALAKSAAEHFGLTETDVKAAERMGGLHDLGKVSVSPGIWYKTGELTDSEWERVRLHPYYTERILARVNVLGRLASCAALHHERLDGSGYHRGVTASVLSPEARLLAAANFYQARVEHRSFREAMTAEEAADELRAQARLGRLDSDAVQAVLAAAGHHTTPVRRDRIAGLTEREIEVLRLIARGFSSRWMAQHLSLSEKTVGNHIMHIYEKINVSTRAAATLFAMQHNLVGDMD